MNYLIGLDIGTSSVKGVLVSADGKELVTGRSPFVYDHPEEGWFEISAEKYLGACYDVLKQLTAALPAGAKVCGLSAASASGNLVLLDQNNQALTPVFNWQDTRVTYEFPQIFGEDFDKVAYFDRIGWRYSGKGFPIGHLCWEKIHHPEHLTPDTKVMMSTEYLYTMLTGTAAISTSAATPSYLVDQRTGEYIKETLEALDLKESQLPRVAKVGEIVGTVTAEAAAKTGVPEGTPVMVGTFDHPSAARAVGVLEIGQMLLSCGTSWVGFCPITDRKIAIDNCFMAEPFLSEKGGTWACLVSVASISNRIEVFVRRYIANSGNIYGEFAKQAALSEKGSGGLVIDLLSDDQDAEISKYPKHHIARAIMEATARMVKEKLDSMAASGVSTTSAVMVGGPSENPMWPVVLHEITGLDVTVQTGAHAGAIGAAIVAGIAAGLYEDEKAAQKVLHE